MGFRVAVKAKTRAELVRQSNPGVGDQPEALSWVFYDTQPYVSGATVRLPFFQQTGQSQAITNMEAGGQLPDPQFFEIAYFGCDILTDVFDGATAAAGGLNDVQRLVLTSQAYWSFNISNKSIGPFPLSFCHASGGVTGFVAGATATLGGYANNGIFDGGFCVDQAITIPPKVGFFVDVNWPTAVTLGQDPTQVRFWMAGTLHRRVL